MKNKHQIIILIIISLLTISSTSNHFSPHNDVPEKKELLDGNFWIRWKIHSGFTSTEKILIEKALKILVNRLTEDRIIQNVYDIIGNSGYSLDGGVWERANLGYRKGYADLLWWQIAQLEVKGRYQEFPKINIYPYHKEEQVWAKAPLSTVTLTAINGAIQFKTKR